MIKNIRDNGRAAWKAEFRIFLKLYKYDLPPFCDIEIEMVFGRFSGLTIAELFQRKSPRL